MKKHIISTCQVIPVLLAVFLFTSCEDKSLVEKNEKLRQRIEVLKKEVEEMAVDDGEDPGQLSAQLHQANEDLKGRLEDLEKLDKERVKLEAEHAELEQQFNEYQKKFQIKE